jgi:hypothetical protein
MATSKHLFKWQYFGINGRLRPCFADGSPQFAASASSWREPDETLFCAGVARPCRQRGGCCPRHEDHGLRCHATGGEPGAREEDKLHDVSQTLQDQAGAVYEMFRQACAVHLDAEVGREFHTMDVANQRTLIESAITAADRAEEYAASSNNITDAEFDDVCMCVLQATKQLKLVLNSSRFKTHAQREAAAAANVG